MPHDAGIPQQALLICVGKRDSEVGSPARQQSPRCKGILG